jgi:hypothetical protein
MAECRNRKQRKTKKHPTGVVTAKECAAGKKLQKLPAVKAWSKAVKEQIGFKKGAFNKIPKRGTAAHDKLVKRQQEILKNAEELRRALRRARAPRRSGRARKATNFFGF